MGIVCQLVTANGAHSKIAGLGVRHHQTRDAGVRTHGTTLCESDAYLVEVQQLVEHEVETGIWQ